MDASVVYIGNQYLNAASGGWQIGGPISDADSAASGGNTNPSTHGIFANRGNISTLITGSNLSGIGDYAFYGCTSLRSFQFENGLNSIGNHAFDMCTSLSNITLPASCNLQDIGAYAFKDCSALTNFTVPINVRQICDGAFQNCNHLTTLDLTGGNVVSATLSHLGNYVFENCAALQSLTFPERYTETLEISEFSGCRNLRYITTHNNQIDFIDSTVNGTGTPSANIPYNVGSGSAFADFTIESFMAQLGEDVRDIFYMEGTDLSSADHGNIHKRCTERQIAYKYLDKDVYEVTITEEGGGTATYQVNSANVLLACNLKGEVQSLNFPNHIGPYHIAKIEEGTFKDKCSLKTVSIPSTIEEIGREAFKGCHNLGCVIFDTDLVVIGEDAFKTQDTGTHTPTCSTQSVVTNADNSPAVELCFVGPISMEATPFRYAMAYSGRYNNGSQKESFIKYYSGWPTNLTVEYVYDSDPTMGRAELVDFPSLSELNLKYGPSSTLPYMTDEYKAAASTALNLYQTSPSSLTEYQKAFVDSALNPLIPDGIDSIKDGLFKEKPDVQTVTLQGVKAIESGYTKTDAVLDGEDVVFKNSGDFRDCDNIKEIYITGATTSIEPYSFYGCDGLEKVEMSGYTYSLGDRAFEDCTSLKDVYISSSLNNMGIVPFIGCSSLADVAFGADSNFTCENSILFSTEDGMKTGLIECLKGKTTPSVIASEVPSSVTAISESAFEDTNIRTIDLSSSNIKRIPSNTFKDTEMLDTVNLPKATSSVAANSFTNSRVYRLNIPSPTTILATDALNGRLSDNSVTLFVNTPADGAPYEYVSLNKDAQNLQWQEYTEPDNFNVLFYIWSPELGNYTLAEEKTVVDGTVLTSGNLPDPYGGKAESEFTFQGESGYTFQYWEDQSPTSKLKLEGRPRPTRTYDNMESEITVTYDMAFRAYYEGASQITYTVNFYDEDNTLLKGPIVVSEGADAREEAPRDPSKASLPDGTRYTFIGWDTGIYDLSNVQHDINAIAKYQEVDGYVVRFIDWDMTTVLSTQTVKAGASAVTPVSPTRQGYIFSGWSRTDYTNVTQDMDIYALYDIDPTTVTGVTHTVRFFDQDDTLLNTQKVVDGQDAIPIQAPTKEGYTFTGWKPALTNITKDTDVYAQYEKNTSDDNGNNSNSGNSGNSGNSNNGGSSSNGSGGTTSKTYNLTVINGSGSGSYVAGSQPIIVANDPASGKEFDNWTIDPADTKLASKVLSASVVTMPASDVTVTAHYKNKKVVTSTVSGNTSSSGASGSRPNNSGTISSGGTTVVIDKNGLSNTGVVSAKVYGASDNFTIKVTEKSSATEAVLRALMAEYGNNIDNIKYFPMDISLYDATGTTKITDTTGLSVSITLPLPDSMIQYAGNNKVAGVVNDKLDKLSPKFNTISGVSCITFTAEHFSPYVIYVDTNNLTAGVISDDTPKTGDGIHPKWFLSLGLAAISIILFLKRDRAVPKKAKVKVKA
jgi:uncharacterized membrane protein YgcG